MGERGEPSDVRRSSVGDGRPHAACCSTPRPSGTCARCSQQLALDDGCPLAGLHPALALCARPPKLTRGMLFRAPTMVEASHSTTMLPAPYTTTLVLFSTLSHCSVEEGRVRGEAETSR